MAHNANPAGARCRRLNTVAAILSLALARPTAATPVEPLLAQCIASETAARPWLEKTLWGLRDQEGGWVGAAVLNADGSVDLGPLQINSSWVPRIAALVHRPKSDVRIWLTNDPCFNVRAASWLFLTALSLTNNYWQAVGLYHSPTAWRQRRYAYAVAGRISRRFGTDAFAEHRQEASAADFQRRN